MTSRGGFGIATLILLARVADADDAPPPDPLAIQIHGFVSQGALLTSDNNYLARDEHGSLEFTEAGINFTKPLDDQLTVGVQLFARDLGPDGNYSAKFDWLDLDYHWKDWLGFRAGRVKIPFGLYNDTSDIDAVQPVALLPQSVYSITNRNFLLAQTGVELYGYLPIGNAGALDYSAYLGSLFLTLDDGNGVHFTSVSVPYVTGGRVMWETPVEGLRFGASVAGEIDATYELSAAPTLGSMDATLFQANYLGSVEYQNHGFLLAAEYGRSHARSTAGGVTQREILEAMYGMASYHWRPWLQTTAYYSLEYPNIDNRSGRENHQHDAGKVDFHPEPIELTKVVTEVLAVLKTTSSKQQVDITTEIATDVEQLVLDSSRLKQVLYNYISNALKFTPSRGRVVVRALAEGVDRLRIEVEDTGSGIAPDQLGRLFGDFQQTEEGARRSDGTGLGLALTKRLVEAQGGEVGVRSVLGSGSTFHAILPRQFGIPKAPAMTLEIVRTRVGAPTILVVEDELGDRERLVSTLVNVGYTVEAVATGAEAIERCEAHEYDAITLDLLLPDMNGLEVLQRIRDGRNGKVPIIVVTVVAERGAVAGFAVHDVLSKPLVESSLLASLSRAGVRIGHGPSIVLVVDDDTASLKVMAATLNRLGYLAVCEQDPVRGLRVAAEQPPSAIVLDLLMPGMTGFEFLDQLRASPVARSIPVIVWTSKDLTPDERARLRSSARTVVAKGTEGHARVLAELASALPNHARGRG